MIIHTAVSRQDNKHLHSQLKLTVRTLQDTSIANHPPSPLFKYAAAGLQEVLN